jgi:signal transduction histidine kinase
MAISTINFVFLIQSISEYKSKLEKNNNSIALFSNVFESSPIPICVVNQELDLKETNFSFQELFQVDVRISSLLQLLSKEDIAFVQNTVDQVYITNDSVEIDYALNANEQAETLFNIQAFSVSSDAESLVTLMFKDVSERRQNQQLAAYQEALDKMNVELDQFVYKTAHDLRAPLTNLIGLIGLMRNETSLEVLSTCFNLQETSFKKMDDFIQKITAYTKNTRLPISVTKINFNRLIDSVINELIYYDKSEFVHKSVVIQEGIEFYSDVERLEIILRNLLANAIKFSNTNHAIAEINIKISKTPNGCKIELIDNGLGIPQSIQHKVFGMFYRGHASADGSGIGLYIVKETTAKLGGTIDLESEENKFTKIILNLPSIPK